MNTQTTIPGSFVDESVKQIRWRKMGDMQLPMGVVAKTYYAERSDGVLKAMVSCDPVGEKQSLWHISVSHESKICGPDGKPQLVRCPTWDELKHAKYTLVPVDITMSLVIPKRSTENYVNTHASCLHLYQCSDDQGY